MYAIVALSTVTIMCVPSSAYRRFDGGMMFVVLDLEIFDLESRDIVNSWVENVGSFIGIRRIWMSTASACVE
jgi:hypothetical protein